MISPARSPAVYQDLWHQSVRVLGRIVEPDVPLVTDTFAVATTVAVFRDAVHGSVAREDSPTVVADSGVENVNADVDGLIESGLLSRVLALRDVTFSNSMIEAWWRTLKHQWRFLHTLDSPAAVRRLVAFYVAAHNAATPHSAFRGHTPEEMYHGRSERIPEHLEAARQQARERPRLFA